MHAGSIPSWLSTFEVGERRYFETTIDRYASDMRTHIYPRSRRPPEIKDAEFAANLFTAVSSRKASDVRYMICVERIK